MSVTTETFSIIVTVVDLFFFSEEVKEKVRDKEKRKEE